MEKAKEPRYEIKVYEAPDPSRGKTVGFMIGERIYTPEQKEALDAQEKAAKIIGNSFVHTWGNTPEGKEFEAAYNAIKAKYPDESLFCQMTCMYEFGRAQGIKAERKRRSRKKALKTGSGNTLDELLEREEDLMLELEAL